MFKDIRCHKPHRMSLNIEPWMHWTASTTSSISRGRIKRTAFLVQESLYCLEQPMNESNHWKRQTMNEWRNLESPCHLNIWIIWDVCTNCECKRCSQCKTLCCQCHVTEVKLFCLAMEKNDEICNHCLLNIVREHICPSLWQPFWILKVNLRSDVKITTELDFLTSKSLKGGIAQDSSPTIDEVTFETLTARQNPRWPPSQINLPSGDWTPRWLWKIRI